MVKRAMLALAALCIALSGCSLQSSAANIHLQSAARLLSQNKRRQAAAQVAAAIRSNPRRLSTYRVAALLYEAKDRYADAAGLYETALRLNSPASSLSTEEKAELYTSLALCYQQAGRLRGAERAYKDALAVAPDSPELMNDLGYFYATTGYKLPEAVSLLKHAVELAPGRYEIIDSLGWAQYKLGDVNEAAKNLFKAVQKDPNQAEVRYHLGAVYLKLGRRNAARIELEKALVLDNSLKEASALLRTLQK